MPTPIVMQGVRLVGAYSRLRVVSCRRGVWILEGQMGLPRVFGCCGGRVVNWFTCVLDRLGSIDFGRG